MCSGPDDDVRIFHDGGGVEEGGFVDQADYYFFVGGMLDVFLSGVIFDGAGAEEDAGKLVFLGEGLG